MILPPSFRIKARLTALSEKSPYHSVSQSLMRAASPRYGGLPIRATGTPNANPKKRESHDYLAIRFGHHSGAGACEKVKQGGN
jgi:hypothetical protein